MVLEEIHNLEEIKHIATAVGQSKKGAWNKWESVKNKTNKNKKKQTGKLHGAALNAWNLKMKLSHKSTLRYLINTS